MLLNTSVGARRTPWHHVLQNEHRRHHCLGPDTKEQQGRHEVKNLMLEHGAIRSEKKEKVRTTVARNLRSETFSRSESV